MARVPEGRREPFKETFLCLKKEREIEREGETRNMETHNKVSGLAGRLAGMRSCGQGGGLGAPRHQAVSQI